MKILLATRGSNGDIIPYLNLASELKNRGHEVLINLPKVFENLVIPYELDYVLQDYEDINGMIHNADNEEKSFGVKTLLDWVKNSISKQFDQLIPLVEDADIFVSTNTEFAASSIAEYCAKPFVRTAYAPFLPGKRIPPPLLPYTKENSFLVPAIWKLINGPTNLMMSSIINKNRKRLGMKPIRSITHHSVSHAYNTLLYSPSLGTVDRDWKWQWDICGYCFNDTFKYNEDTYRDLIDFIRQDTRPTIFFTFGSCTSKNGERFVDYIASIAKEKQYKLVIGSGWSNTGLHLENSKDIFLMMNPIPHNLIFPECDAVIHHGGTGTTHSVARQGKPQMIVPLLLDQYYWGSRINKLGIGTQPVKIGNISKDDLQRRVTDLVTNNAYKNNALNIKQQMGTENAIDKFCDLVAQVV